jgi:hypothetical protein
MDLWIYGSMYLGMDRSMDLRMDGSMDDTVPIAHIKKCVMEDSLQDQDNDD